MTRHRARRDRWPPSARGGCDGPVGGCEGRLDRRRRRAPCPGSRRRHDNDRRSGPPTVGRRRSNGWRRAQTRHSHRSTHDPHTDRTVRDDHYPASVCRISRGVDRTNPATEGREPMSDRSMRRGLLRATGLAVVAVPIGCGNRTIEEVADVSTSGWTSPGSGRAPTAPARGTARDGIRPAGEPPTKPIDRSSMTPGYQREPTGRIDGRTNPRTRRSGGDRR